ncbi:MAG TPA: hypothetical protein VFR49_12595, partial [Solirubrobacteraceae bacterium]|nr:hypothetical protein [Solirubrobacteraceae bacterium]
MILAASFYQVVLAVHIMAVVATFGMLFAYPLALSAGRRLDPRGLPSFHRVQRMIIQRLVSPGLLLVLIAGIYLAADASAFSKLYVQWGFVAVIVLGGLTGGYLAPREARLAELAERDLAAGGALGSEYDAL